jgi:hypothetical protein
MVKGKLNMKMMLYEALENIQSTEEPVIEPVESIKQGDPNEELPGYFADNEGGLGLWS